MRKTQPKLQRTKQSTTGQDTLSYPTEMEILQHGCK